MRHRAARQAYRSGRASARRRCRRVSVRVRHRSRGRAITLEMAADVAIVDAPGASASIILKNESAPPALSPTDTARPEAIISWRYVSSSNAEVVVEQHLRRRGDATVAVVGERLVRLGRTTARRTSRRPSRDRSRGRCRALRHPSRRSVARPHGARRATPADHRGRGRPLRTSACCSRGPGSRR